MAHFVPATLVLSAVAVFSVMANAPAHQKAREPEFQIQALIEDAKEWTLSNSENGSICLVHKTSRISNVSTTIALDPSCAEVFDPVKAVSALQMNDDHIRLVDNAGEEVLELARVGQGLTFANSALRMMPN